MDGVVRYLTGCDAACGLVAVGGRAGEAAVRNGGGAWSLEAVVGIVYVNVLFSRGQAKALKRTVIVVVVAIPRFSVHGIVTDRIIEEIGLRANQVFLPGCYTVKIVDRKIVDSVALIAYNVLESACYVIAIVSIFVIQYVVYLIELAVGGVFVLLNRLDNLFGIVVDLTVLFPLHQVLIAAGLFYESAELIVGIVIHEVAIAVHHRKQLSVKVVIIAYIVIGVRRHSSEGIVSEVVGRRVGSDARKLVFLVVAIRYALGTVDHGVGIVRGVIGSRLYAYEIAYSVVGIGGADLIAHVDLCEQIAVARVVEIF